MKTLALDTSTKYLSLALYEDDKCMIEYHEEAGIKHSEVLAPEVQNILDSVGWTIRDIDLIAAGIGPGSFTGLRIGIATVKGFAAVCKSKVVGVPTMDAIVRNVQKEHGSLIAVMLDARKDKIYLCLYDLSREEPARISDYELITVSEFVDRTDYKCFCIGDAVEKYKEQLDVNPLIEYDAKYDWYPHAENIGIIGIRSSSKSTDTPDELEPMYLHAKECQITTPKKK